MESEYEYEYEEIKINFDLKLKINPSNIISLEYTGKTPDDQRLVNMKKYGSGVNGIDFRDNKTIKKINELNRKLKSLRIK